MNLKKFTVTLRDIILWRQIIISLEAEDVLHVKQIIQDNPKYKSYTIINICEG